MIKISKQQIAERWDSLPDELLDALVSEANSDFIWKVSEEENLPEEKIKLVAMVTGHVLMGFIHPEDVARELKTIPGIDPKTAATLETALIQRIFTPIRAQIDAVYAPLSKLEVEPSVVLEITPTPASVPSGPQILSESFAAQPNAAPKPISMVPPQNIAPPAASTNSPGWSRRTQQDPVVKLGVITPGMPKIPSAQAPAAPLAPVPAVSSTPASASSAGPQKSKTISEFERLDMQKKGAGAQTTTVSQAGAAPTVGARMPASVPTPMPRTPSPIPAPPPVMLHEVGGQVKGQTDQHFQVNTGMQNQMGDPSMIRSPAPPKPAVIEFGAPRPAAPPKPPTPPPANKVIVKDFLE